MMLSRNMQERARVFLFEEARPLERSRYAYHFGHGDAHAVCAELAAFQNDDGGFGHALEPDVRLPGSSVIATTVGLQVLREVGAGEHSQLVQGAMRYLIDTYDEEHECWPQIPPETNDAPHAPWMTYQDDPEGWRKLLANPRAEIIGYLCEHAGLVPSDLRERLVAAAVTHLEANAGSLEMHELYCYLRLVDAESLHGEARDTMLPLLTQAVDRVVVREPAKWTGYCARPLDLVSSPDSPFAAMLGAAIDANLDYLIEQQQNDGAWPLTWSWAADYPEAWAQAERDWKGVRVVRNLRVLRSFGRLD